MAASLETSVACLHCGASLAKITTGRKAGGNPKIVVVDPVPDAAGTYACTLTSAGTYSGNECTKGQLRGARAHGVPLYVDHTLSCPKRGTNHR